MLQRFVACFFVLVCVCVCDSLGSQDSRGSVVSRAFVVGHYKPGSVSLSLSIGVPAAASVVASTPVPRERTPEPGILHRAML